ncbi:MAG: hypothetical protein ACREV9_09740 [Burkholderiales bacterium]
MEARALDLSNVERAVDALKLGRSVTPANRFFAGGTHEAKRRFRRFIKQNLAAYKKHRNQPHTDDTSHMSPYLHFGQISPLYLALEIATIKEGENRDSFLEELIVRRELGMNYVHFTPEYDSLKSLPRWAKTTLNANRNDEREYLYSRDQLEAAATHDPYWNAAMDEAKATG